MMRAWPRWMDLINDVLIAIAWLMMFVYVATVLGLIPVLKLV